MSRRVPASAATSGSVMLSSERTKSCQLSGTGKLISMRVKASKNSSGRTSALATTANSVRWSHAQTVVPKLESGESGTIRSMRQPSVDHAASAAFQ